MTQPIDLYRIVMGTSVWTMTAADDQVYNAGSGNEIYVKTAIKRNTIEQKNEISKATLDVSIPIDHPIALSLLTTYTEQILSLTVFTKTDADVEVSWKGRLASLKPGDSELTLIFESIFTSLRRPGLRARFQRSCRHALYGRGCGIDYTLIGTAGVVTAISGVTLTIPAAAAQPNGYFTAGMIAPADGFLSYIINHVGNQITLQRVSYSILRDFALTGITTPITMYPGCDHTRVTCNSKFNNLLNYGGFDWIPEKNPMGGSSIV